MRIPFIAILLCLVFVSCAPYDDSWALCSERIDEGNFSGAIVECDAALIIDSHNSQAYSERGYAKERVGRFDDALSDYGKAIVENPTNGYPYANRCTLLTDLGEYDLAISDCDNAVRLLSHKASVYANRAYTREKLGDREGAVEDLRIAVELDPFNEDYLYGLQLMNSSEDIGYLPVDDYPQNLSD